MNRRTFIASFAATPLVARIPGLQSLVPHAERRYRPAPVTGTSGRIQVEVRLAWNEREARGLRSREAHDPFDGMVGEFYIDDAHTVDIPDHIPGSLTSYTTIVGYAAERGVVHTGAFRRGNFVWTVRVTGDLAWALDAAEWIAAVELPDEGRVRLAPALLEHLLPSEGDFSIDVRVAEP